MGVAEYQAAIYNGRDKVRDLTLHSDDGQRFAFNEPVQLAPGEFVMVLTDEGALPLPIWPVDSVQLFPG